MTEVHESTLMSEPEFPVEMPKPRRHWRVTKADLTGRIAELEQLAEHRASLLEKWQFDVQAVTKCADFWKVSALRWRLAALAGWAAFAAAVVW